MLVVVDSTAISSFDDVPRLTDPSV